jgi:hypothetical protein
MAISSFAGRESMARLIAGDFYATAKADAAIDNM